MRLKKLNVFGFKSFAEQTALNFEADLIAIVGPNGCGKSNIVDAFRWVMMGEQSAKSMRGDKMHDILFSGSASRQPLNLAEVSVTLTAIQDNELPLPYEEITLTRKLYREGESEYLLNKQPIRLKDLHILFAGTGLGKYALSVFEQGKLDQVIHLHPKERRAIFDDIAGIGRFLQRKKESLRKLEEIANNYCRLNDLFKEIEKQVVQLKKQAIQAQHYQGNKQRLDLLELTLLAMKLKSALETEEDLLKKLHMQQAQADALKQSIDTQAKALKHHHEERKRQEEVYHRQKERLYQMKSQLQCFLAEKERSAEKRRETEERQQKLQEEIISIELARRERKLSHHRCQKALIHLECETQRARKCFEDNRRGAFTLDQITAQFQLERKQCQQEYLKWLDEEKKCAAKIQALDWQIEQYEQKKEHRQVQAEELKEMLRSLENGKIAKEKNVQDLVQEIEALKQQLGALENRAKQARLKADENQNACTDKHQKLAHWLAHKSSLDHLQKTSEGFSSEAKKLLEASQDPTSPFHHAVFPLSKHLSSEEQVLLCAYRRTLAVKDREALAHVIAYVKEHKLCDISLLCLEILSKSHLKKGIKRRGALLDALQDKQFHQTITEDGFWIDSKGVIHSEFSDHNHAQRTQALNAACQEITQLKKLIQKLESAFSQSRHDLESCEEKRSALDKERHKKEMRLIEKNFELQSLREELALTLEHIEKLNKEAATGQKMKHTLSAQRSQLASQKTEMLRSIQAYRKKWQQKEEEMEANLQKRQEAASRLLESEKNYKTISGQSHCLKDEVRRLEIQDQEGRHLYERLLHEHKTCEDNLKKTIEHYENLEKETASAEFALESMSDCSQNEEMQLEKDLDLILGCESRLSDLRQELDLLESQKIQTDKALAENRQRLQHLEFSLSERFSLSPQEAQTRALSDPGTLNELEAEIRELRTVVDQSNAINLAAIEEHQAQKQRLDFLTEQIDDLRQGQADLENIIIQLDNESRKQFKDTFRLVKQNFQKNFSILFGGGSADLSFTDSPDVLEAGIEIAAQPPGKQMRTLSLLSGGEKCLTALALLFSLFEVRPAPFCILDEVDAPLDDSNIGRFIKLVRQFTGKTQFILVTHNKKTMAAADLLLGVSMEEKGISKLISLEFETGAVSS